MSRPNLLFIFPDQWRADALSGLGHPLAETPFLDDLTARGTWFSAAYSDAPVCIPARAALITGCSPSTCGRLAYHDGLPWPYDQTLMACLRDGGYQTWLAGKTHFWPARAHLGCEQLALYDNQRLEPGFESDYDRWLARETGGRVTDTAQRLNSNSMVVHPWTADEQLHANAWTVTAAIDFLERRDPTRPWFGWVGFHRPHPPLDPPESYFRRYEHRPLPEPPVGDWAAGLSAPTRRMDPDRGRLHPALFDRARRGYYAQLAHLDFEIGRLLRWLQLRDQLRNTWLVFASDHGEQLGDHHLFRKSTPLEGSAAIPLLVVPPPESDAPRGRVCDAPVTLRDLLPTFLEWAGLPVPATVEGRSLAPLVAGEAVDWRSHAHLELSRSPLGAWQAVTDGRRKYVWFPADGRELYFDLETDPTESRDLSAEPARAEEIEVWRQRLVAELATRPEDGLVAAGRLQPGRVPPATRPWLLELAAREKAAG